MIKVSNCTVQEFRIKTKEKKIVCFCAGQNFYNFCEIFQIADKILYVVDNYHFGTDIEINEYKIPVISMADLQSEMKECIWVITTVKFADEIIKQLDRLEISREKEVYFPDLFFNDEQSIILNKSGENKIPKVIHYFWFGNKEIPDEYKRNIESWQRFCQDYEIICWNEKNYDVTKNPYMYQAYKEKKWGFVPDYARLDIVYTYGGIYLDTDVEIVRSLDELLKCSMFCGFESSLNVNMGQGFGAVRHHELIGKMMRAYDGAMFRNEDGSLNLTPSPIYQTNLLCELGLKKNGKVQDICDAMILSTEYFSPYNEYGYGKMTENTYAIHHYAGSWYDDEQKKEKKRIEQNYRYLMDRIKK